MYLESTGKSPRLTPAEIDPKAALQADADTLFQERTQLIFPGKLGKIVLKQQNLADRPPNHATLIDQYLLEADESRTEKALARFRGIAGNVDKAASTLDEAILKNDLDQYPSLLILAPHTSMPDILGLTYTSFFTESLGKNRTASDNYMYLSRLLGYASFRTLFSKNMNTVEQHIVPLTNVVQVFPETKSLASLREKHEDEIRRANNRATLAARRHQKYQDSSAQKITFLAPNGTQMKRYKDGKRAEEAISPSTYNLIHQSYVNNTPILIAGFEMDWVRAALHIPILSMQNWRLHARKQEIVVAVEKPILPEEGLSIEELRAVIEPRLYSVARQVSKKAIYA